MLQLGGNTFGLCVYSWDNFWFRVMKHGLSVMPLKDHKPLFSERNGKRKAWHSLGHCWRIL
jgi:hypothetical protein